MFLRAREGSTVFNFHPIPQFSIKVTQKATNISLVAYIGKTWEAFQFHDGGASHDDNCSEVFKNNDFLKNL